MTKRFIAVLVLIAACGEPVAPPTAIVRPTSSGLTTDAAPETQIFFGPERFVRSNGAPTRFSRTISTTGFIAPFVLHVKNGASDGSSRVSSARLSVGGVELLGPKNINPNQAEWTFPVAFPASASLEVQLTSKPGSYLEVWITGAPELPTWSLLSPTGIAPSARYFHSAVYDESNDRMIVFGGASEVPGPVHFNDTWILEHASGFGGTPSWTELATAGAAPSPRSGHAGVYDPASNRMIVVDGGTGSTTMLNDVWVLSNANGLGGIPTWTQLAPGAGPAGRTYHSAAFDAASNRMIIFGGNLSEGHCFNEANDAWVLANANGLGGLPAWSQLLPTGAPPAIRNLGGAVYDPSTNRMTVLWGRLECAAQRTDVWTLTNANGTTGTPAWTQLFATGAPAPRSHFSTVYDAANQSATIFGGTTGGVFNDEVWVLNDAVGQAGTPAWTQIIPVGTGPGVRGGQTAVFNTRLNRMIVFGGYYGPAGNEVWVLSGANGRR